MLENGATPAQAPTWNLDLLARVQPLLALQVGPVAKLLLKNASAASADLDGLCERLLPHIPTDAGRSAFLDGIGALRKEFALGAARVAPAPAAAAPPSAPAQALTPDMLELAEKKLTVYMGPIARVLVKKAARQCADRPEFFRLLAAHIASPEDSKRFLHEVGVA
ncbi:MAG: hypothetical protein V4508_05135 [Pseudomonadota bacterium]